jgi:hypothetical protein
MRVVLCVCSVATVLVVATAARADLITPTTILAPPQSVVGSADGTPITSSAYLVSNQYAGAGLIFPTLPGPVPGTGPTVAITSLGGVTVWAPATFTEAMADRIAALPYRGTITGQLVHPTGRLSMEVIGPFGETLSAYDSHHHLLGFSKLTGPAGPHGGTLLSIQAPDIASFTVTGPLLMACPVPHWTPPPWGIAEVQTSTAAHAPEPASWLLGALGGLGAWVPALVARKRGPKRTG